jgi:hypothetical protein
MKYALLSIAALAGMAGAPLAAQQPAMPNAGQSASIAEGTTVYGSDGTAVGKVARAQGNLLVLDVDGRAIPVSPQALADGEKGPTINVTKTELAAQYDEQMAAFKAKMDAALTTGAAVQTADGRSLGTIQKVNEQAVEVESADGPVTLPRRAMTLDNEGTLIVRATMDQIKQAMSAQPGQG